MDVSLGSDRRSVCLACELQLPISSLSSKEGPGLSRNLVRAENEQKKKKRQGMKRRESGTKDQGRADVDERKEVESF